MQRPTTAFARLSLPVLVRLLTHLWNRRYSAIVLGLLALLAIKFEHKISDWMMTGEHPDVSETIFRLSGLYQTLTSARSGSRKPVHTVLVEIDRGETGATCLCGEDGSRARLGRLIRRIAALQPRVIVIDKYFGDKACRESDRGTAMLVKTLQDVGKHIPIILGQVARRGPDGVPTLQSAIQPGSIPPGIINVNNDTRRIPLRWSIKDPKNPKTEEERDSLSLAAAEAFRPGLSKPSGGPLPRLIKDGSHPYVHFFAQKEFCTLKAAERTLPDGEAATNDAALTADPWTIKPTGDCSRDPLDGKAAMVGEMHDRMDLHSSPLGSRTPGFLLQANYLEGLLTDHYFEPLERWDELLGLLIAAALYLGGLYLQYRIVAFYAFVSLLAVSCWAVLWFLTSRNWYVEPTAIGVPVLLYMLIHPLFHRSHHWATQSLEATDHNTGEHV